MAQSPRVEKESLVVSFINNKGAQAKPAPLCYNIFMRFIIGLLSLVLVGAVVNYWLMSDAAMCRLPVQYSIGQIDSRFNLTNEEAKATLAEAEKVWEDSLGRDDIFEYKDNANLRINFVYDERQVQTNEITNILDDLSMRGEANEVLVELHKRLVDKYEEYEAKYETLRTAYEKNLTAYNAEVDKYNRAGGAPKDIYDQLELRKKSLDKDRDEVNSMGNTMSQLVDQINSISEKGNELIQEYNTKVNRFNDNYINDEEYTQGDYKKKEINVYSFSDHHELELVLAHELGHSLSIDHVNNPESIMYYLMGQQPEKLTLSAEDIDAFNASCNQGWVSRLLTPLKTMYNYLNYKK